jgi:methylenetetrahydrofolate dehydrogenase (NADP+) / methenyltetrahydrofolate cyclohydrolase
VTAMDAELVARTTVLPRMPHLVMLEGIGTSHLAHEVNTYVAGKQSLAESLGMVATHMPVSPDEMPWWIGHLNDDDDVNALIVEHPIPGLDREEEQAILDCLDGRKAVDNQGIAAEWGMPATSESVVRLLDYHGHTGKDTHVLIVGSMGRVAGPLADVYANPDRGVAELSLVDKHNKDKLPKLARAAGMVIVATGMPDTLTPDIVHDGQVIAVVGARDAHPDVRTITDRDFSLTPKKGGVGLLTQRVLLSRVVDLAEGGNPQPPFTATGLVRAAV